MTKEQFDLKYRGEKVAVHCDTEEKAKAFLSLAKSFGYTWNGGDYLDNYWYVEKEKTCYRVISDGVMTGDKIFYKAYGCTIVEFELDEPNGYAIEDTPSPMEETFKIGDVVYRKHNDERLVIIGNAFVCKDVNGFDDVYLPSALTHTKPLKKITEKELAEMGYVLVK